MALGRDDAVLASDLLGHQLHHVEVQGLQFLLGDRLLAELPPEVLEQDLLVEELHLDEDLPEPVLGLALAGQRLSQLLLGQDAVVEQHLAQRDPAPALGRLAHSSTLEPETSASRRRTSSRVGWGAGLRRRKAR